MAAFSMKMTYNGGAAQYSAALHRKLSLVVKKTANIAMQTAKDEIANGEKTGRIYLSGKNHDIEHQASAPYEAPASDTGALMTSIRVEHEGDLTSNIVVPATTSKDGGEGGLSLGLILELGTAWMAPRPFMSPALTAVEPAFRAQCEEAIATS